MIRQSQMEAALREAAKIAAPWPGYWIGDHSTADDRATVKMREEMRDNILALIPKYAALAAEADRGVGEPVADYSAETFVIKNSDNSISLDPYHGMTREQLKARCCELVTAVTDWRIAAMSAAEANGNSITNVREPYRSQIQSAIDSYSDDESMPPASTDARMREALEKIACRHVTIEPLWWQIEARQALASAPREASAPVIDAVRDALEAADDLVSLHRDYSTMPYPDFQAKHGPCDSTKLFSEIRHRYVEARALLPTPASVQGNSSDGGVEGHALNRSNDPKGHVSLSAVTSPEKAGINPGPSDPAPQGQDARELGKQLDGIFRSNYTDRPRLKLAIEQFVRKNFARTRAPEATEAVAWGDGPRPRTRPDGVPTRCDLRYMTPAERAITAATQAVEQAGGSIALTDAVTLLSKARDRVADHVEDVPAAPVKKSLSIRARDQAGLIRMMDEIANSDGTIQTSEPTAKMLEKLADRIEELEVAAPPAKPVSVETIARGIREFCNGLSPHAVQRTPEGVDRIYYPGTPIDDLARAIHALIYGGCDVR